MKKILSLFFALLTVSVLNAKVAFLVPADNTNEVSMPYEEYVQDEQHYEQSPELRAWRWFNDNFVTPNKGQFICFSDLDNIPSDIHAIWIYVDRVGFNESSFDALFADHISELQDFVNAGGNIFLCKQATRLEKDLVGAKKSDNTVLEPSYEYGDYKTDYNREDKWGMSCHFYDEAEWGSYLSHAMFAPIPADHKQNDRHIEMIWSDPLANVVTNNNCLFTLEHMEMGNTYDRDRLSAFQSRNNCKVLGCWSNGNDCHCGGLIEFYPNGNRKGTVIMMGLAAYQWINNNGGWGIENIQYMTKGALEYLDARPQSNGENPIPMEDKLAESFFYPSNTTTFRTLHPDCEGLSAAYSIASDPNNIARIHDGKLQFKAAGTVTLRIALTENRGEFKAWPKGTYYYDRAITFAYANADAAQDAVNEDLPGTGIVNEGGVDMAMRLHPSVRGMDSVSYTITNHYDETQGEAYKKIEDGVTRLYFSKSGKVLLNIRLNEPNEYREEWPAGNKDLTRVVEFNYTQEAGPVFPWPAEFTNGSTPKSVITLPETVAGLPVSYTHTGDATLEGNILTLANVESGSVTVQASVTETEVKVTWPVGTYNYENTLAFHRIRPSSGDVSPIPMEDKLAEEFFYPSNTTTFRTLHPVCEGLSAAYSIASDPNEIARIYDGKLQFKAAGTVTLHIVLTESRGNQEWEDGDYEYDREITFSYANPNAAQDAINEDFPANAITDEGGVDMAMRLHPVVRGMDSVSYIITNHYDETQGEALKRTEVEAEHDVTRLYFAKSGKVLLTINLNEPNWVEAWPMGAKQLERVLEFHYTQEAGPVFPWPSEFETGAVGPNSVITLPETVGGLTVNYTVEGNASLSGNVLTLANVESGSVTVHASITETGIRVEWPVGTYNYDNALSFHAAEVGYLLPAAESIDHMAGWYEGEQPEYNAATWFQENYIATGKGRFVTVNELPTLYAKGITTLWVNIERIGITTEEGMFTDMPEGLKTYIQAGGNVLLTKQATRLAYLMKRIGYAPEFNAGGYSTENTNNLRSIATCMGTGEGVNEPLDKSGHRLYSGMLSYWEGKNVFLVAPDCKKTMNYCSWQDFFTNGAGAHAYENNNIQRLKDFENAWSATVFGIQGSIGDYCFSDVVEFNATGDWQGRILAIGSAAYQWGTSNNHVELENMKALTSNALSYLLDKPVEDEVYTRDIMNNMYGTICWGYAVEEGHIEGAEMYELTSFNAAGDAIILTEVTSMMAGRAYFFFATSDQLRLTYHGQKKEAEEGGHNGLVGYIPLTGSDPYHVEANAGKYILYYDKLMLVDSENVYVPVNRAYVDYSQIPAYNAGAPAGPRRRVVHIDRHQTPTGMEEVELPSKQGIYDILGRKVANPQSAGFYIINGQKVVITH